jgi:hypothetical protein
LNDFTFFIASSSWKPLKLVGLIVFGTTPSSPKAVPKALNPNIMASKDKFSLSAPNLPKP